ncbi:MAG: hypothetical protein P8168_08195 [Deltaproteobacteria bacterium]|jgi:hypothetical protein
MVSQEEAIEKISLELSLLYRKSFGRDPNSELIRDEAENIVAKFGPVRALKEIFFQAEDIRGAGKGAFNQEQS